ncbi:MAG: hypothetical protein IPM60_05820 [Rhodospirillales bacterium]|nr:hypothetical protein [Rhodospirillales bacterium]
MPSAGKPVHILSVLVVYNGCNGNPAGFPIVLNTSFNENEPVVCRPEEALDCFLRTRMDVLVIGDWLVRRRQQPG